MKTTNIESINSISADDRELLTKLQEVINGQERPVLLGREGAHIQFPEAVFHVLTETVRMMASGQSVVLLSENEEFTTQGAANHLGMSLSCEAAGGGRDPVSLRGHASTGVFEGSQGVCTEPGCPTTRVAGQVE